MPGSLLLEDMMSNKSCMLAHMAMLRNRSVTGCEDKATGCEDVCDKATLIQHLSRSLTTNRSDTAVKEVDMGLTAAKS